MLRPGRIRAEPLKGGSVVMAVRAPVRVVHDHPRAPRQVIPSWHCRNPQQPEDDGSLLLTYDLQ